MESGSDQEPYTLHLDRPLDRFAVALHLQAAIGASDGNDAVIHRRRQPAIEAHFLVAEMPAFLQRGEIEKAEIDGLFYLVRQIQIIN